jgi:hypothetical protein
MVHGPEAAASNSTVKIATEKTSNASSSAPRSASGQTPSTVSIITTKTIDDDQPL